MVDDRYIPVEGSPGLFRDSRSGAIINMNRTAAQQAREARKKAQERDHELEELKSDVQEIKSILTQLLERL